MQLHMQVRKCCSQAIRRVGQLPQKDLAWGAAMHAGCTGPTHVRAHSVDLAVAAAISVLVDPVARGALHEEERTGPTA